MHLTHRIRRIDDGGPKLEMVIRVEDPRMYSKPWTMIRTFAWRPDKTVFGEQLRVAGGRTQRHRAVRAGSRAEGRAITSNGAMDGRRFSRLFTRIRPGP
jgi:hypothetical protein